MTAFNPPVLLAVNHQLDGFRCRSPEQTSWLVAMARQAHGSGTTRVFVVTELDQPVVAAFYAWCMASVAFTCRIRAGLSVLLLRDIRHTLNTPR